MSEHLLDVQNLRVSFDTYAGEVQAVRGVSFYIDKGETLAIVGESGCGKSVSIQTVMDCCRCLRPGSKKAIFIMKEKI